MAKNKNLHAAKKAKNDEFYTQMSDIEREMSHYKDHFRGKTVLLNCDDPVASNFWKYFELQFDELGLKKLISTHYDPKEPTYKLVLESQTLTAPQSNISYADMEDGTEVLIGCSSKAIKKVRLKGNGDFQSAECIELLDEADIVVTNPPFSLFREYIVLLMEHNTKFIIVGPQNAIGYKEIFPLMKDNKLWLGNGFQGGNAYFRIPDGVDTSQYANGVYNPETKCVKFRNCCWFTNLDLDKRHDN